MFRIAMILLLAGGLLAGFSMAGSALFTSTATVSANTFTTGTVTLTANPTSGLITYTNMAAGDKVTAPLTLSNGGSLQLRYAMTTTITSETGALASKLQLQIKNGVTTCDNTNFGASGTQVYSGTLASAVIGNPAQGQQTGDRSLNGSGSEILCFQATLPIDADNTYQGKAATATFTFNGEQTANNP